MDYIKLGGNVTVDGLGKMLEAALGGPHGYTDSLIAEVPIALYIVEIAKIADDKEEWFPLGKWATIQAIQGRIEKEITTLFKKEGSDGYTN